jgi:membrane fusion protein (multidrug efflux system)
MEIRLTGFRKEFPPRIYPAAAILLLIILCMLFMAAGCSKGPKEAPQAPTVEVMTVIQKDVPVFNEWIGTLDGLVNATIRAQVQGYLI